MRHSFTLLLLVAFICTTIFPKPASAQTKEGYYVLAVLCAAGSAGAFWVFKEVKECDEVTYLNSSPRSEREADCQRRQIVKWGALGLGAALAYGVFWALDEAGKLERSEQQVALINIASGKKLKVKLPDIAYSPQKRNTNLKILSVKF